VLLLLGLADLIDLGDQSDEASVDLFVRQIFDTLLLGNLEFLLGVDVGLVGIAEGVLEQELRAFGRALIFIKAFSGIRFNTLKRIVESELILHLIIITRNIAEKHFGSQAEEEPKARDGVVFVFDVACFEILLDAPFEERHLGVGFFQAVRFEVPP